MAIYQVTRVGTRFGVLEDNNLVPGSLCDTRGEAIAKAIELKEG